MSNYLKPSELLEKHPEIKKIWDRPQKLGYLLTLRLVDGYKTARSCKLKESDVLKVFEFVQKNSE